ncbi:MAG: queuosine precursor transporter [Propionibacteriaceae bacterium]|nr:queuosine precursor transporter [Propionibacteriaceae bacterium]
MTTSAPNPTAPAHAPGRGGNYDVVVAVFVGLLLISNIGATKLIEFGPSVEVGGLPILPIITDGGAFLFPLTYVLGDVLAEVYGLRRARRAIAVGFGMSVLMSLTFLAVAAAPPAADWPNQDAWVTVLGFVPRIVLASLVGYAAGQLLNAWVLVRLKRSFGERSLWVRLVTSTVVGEFIDTLLFCTIAFGPLGAFLGGGSIPLPQLVNYIVVGFVYKVLVEVLLLPVTYRVIAAVKRREPDYG